jgi:hypothetical protein
MISIRKSHIFMKKYKRKDGERAREREGENRNSVKLCEKLRVTLWQKEKGEKRKPK